MAVPKATIGASPDSWGTETNAGLDYLDAATVALTAAAATKTGTETLTNKTLTAPVLGVATGTSLAATAGLTSSGTAGIGYATGAGGTVTQATSRATGVTLNKICGTITGMATSLAASTSAVFVVTNSTVAIGDVVVLSHVSGSTTNTSLFAVAAVAAGSFSVRIANVSTTVADTGAPVLNFSVIKSVSA